MATRQEILANTTREQRRQDLLDNWRTDIDGLEPDVLASIEAKAAELAATSELRQ